MEKNVSIIIIHWNTPELLRKQLISLTSNIKTSELIVIDNASKESLDWINKDFSQVQLIQNKLNRGYAFACNQGTIQSRGEWLLFLNPDVEISNDQIKQLVEYAKKNNLDACSPKTTHSYQKPLPTWFSLLSEFTPLVKLVPLNLFAQKTLFGGCLLIKAEVLKTLGGWDERFFLWFEDSDLTVRLTKNGYRIGWFSAPIKHLGGTSFKTLDNQLQRDIFFQSMDIFARKHFSLFGKFIVSLIKKRYSKRKLLPKLSKETNITIPNLKLNLLKYFFEKNKNILHTSGVCWTVITSSLNNMTIWQWRKRYPDIRFIPIEENKGFASTVNIGFRVSAGNWLGTVNDDIILSRNWLTNLLFCKKDETGSINSTIYKESGDIESAGITVRPNGKAYPLKKLTSESCFEVDATNAAAVIYSQEAINKVGLFDEKFGSYLEDIDLSLRLKRMGYNNLVSLKSTVTHLGQETSKELGWKKQYYDFKNWILVILKNWGIRQLVLNFPAIFIERLRNLSGVFKSF